MACKQWNEQWIARLYDELDPEEDRLLSTHLEACNECRRTLSELEQSRQSLGAASPYVPVNRRVIVLEPGGKRQAVWHLVYSLAAALVVFVVGAWVGGNLLTTGGQESAQLEGLLAAHAEQRVAFENRIGELEATLTAVASRPRPAEQLPTATEAMVTRDEYAIGLEELQHNMQRQRIRDMEFLIGEMNAVEFRAAQWVDETREGVRLVAMQNDPNLSQR
jgi:hypothetical protein